MRPTQLARILILDIARPRDRIGGAAHSAPRRRCFAFRDGHGGAPAWIGRLRGRCLGSAAFEVALIEDRAGLGQSRRHPGSLASPSRTWRRTRAKLGRRRGPDRWRRAGAPPGPAAWRCAAAGWVAPPRATPRRAGWASALIC